MLLFFKSLINTFSALSLVDIIFFFSVMFLLVLIVTLVYFVIINNEDDNKSVNKKEGVDVNNNIKIFDDPNEEGELLDLKAITKKLEEKSPDIIAMNNYEEEQEQKAIISYDELLQKKQDLKINYEEEQQLGDLTVKKVDIDNISTPITIPENNLPKTISYEKEEAFLKALKQLQEQIS